MITPKPLSPFLRVIDYLMHPIMVVISLAPFEKPQESHVWHTQKLSRADRASLNLEECVIVPGNDTSRIKKGSGPLFHIPLIGGWKNFVVLETKTETVPWYIGWIVRDTETGSIIRSDLHRLPLHDQDVRMLVGPAERTTTFFAVDASGNQIPLGVRGNGKMGDGAHGKVRLL